MLAQIRMFMTALEEGSLNRAAARLRMSQSALSRQMQALEAEVGGSLLERTAAGVRPTDAGHALASAIKPVLRDYDAAMGEVRRLARGQRELVRIGYLGSAAQTFINPALGMLRASHPEVKIKLLDLSPGEQIAALRCGEIDIGVIGQEGGVASHEFYTKRLATMGVVAMLPADHRLAGRRSMRLRELRGEAFVRSPEADLPGRDRWIVQLCRKADFRPRFALEAATLAEAFSLVSGEGLVGLMPGYLKDYPAAGVEMVTVSDDWATWDFLIVWQRGRMADTVRAVLDALSRTVDSVCEAKQKPGRNAVKEPTKSA